MVKHKVTADVRSLADRYFCEQCDRLGLPRPHAIKPIKTPKQPVLKDNPLYPHEEDRRSDLDQLAETGVWINTREPAPRMGLEAILKAYGDGE